MTPPYTVLVVDDDREMRDSLQHLLTTGGFTVEMLSGADSVADRLKTRAIDVILCDVRMPGMTGLELQETLKDQVTTPLVLMSAHGDIPMAVKAIHDGAYSFLEKPFDPRRLLRLLENAGRMNRLSQNARRLKARLADLSGIDRILIGDNATIRALREEIVDLSDSTANVMVLGETGTGKELVVRALHDLGPRAGEPFVALNCAALPDDRFEEALFGRADGAPGFLDQANGGTLFLDELGAIPPAFQAKLLRVIDTKEFMPVGSTAPRRSDFRVVSAGTEKIEAALGTGGFREDLYFRLNTIVLRLPALRDRREDIPLLYAHFVRHFAETYEIEAPEITSDDLAVLLAHDWPGNVREVRSVSERRVLAARRGGGSAADALYRTGDQAEVPETLREAVAAFERRLIAKALVTHDGRMDAVAEALGIGRRTLNEKIVKLGLNKDDVLQDGTARGNPQGLSV